MAPDIQLDFQLLDTVMPPTEITKLLNIIPDVELLEGQRNKSLNLPRQNIWSIRSKIKSNEIFEHWNELEKILIGKIDEISKIANTGKVKFTIVINDNQRIPSIIIPPEMSKFAGFVNAIIDIDHLQ